MQFFVGINFINFCQSFLFKIERVKHLLNTVSVYNHIIVEKNNIIGFKKLFQRPLIQFSD